MKSIVFFICFAVWVQVQAQYEVLHQDVIPVDSTIRDFGKNGKRFFYSSYGVQFIIPTEKNAQAPVMLGASLGYKIEFLQKYRLTNMLSLGYIFDLNSLSYRFEQNNDKAFPDTVLHKSQSISYLSMGAGGFLRINFDPGRGDYMGYFIDLGAYSDYHLSRMYKSKDADDMNQIVFNRINRLYFMEKYQYGLYASIGFNRFNVFARYRMSDIFKAPFKSAELPRLSVGIGVSAF